MSRRIHVTGASGAGTTTLGQNLAAALGCTHFDTDDYYWLPADPPFRVKREASERLRLLEAVLNGDGDWVLSGSLVGWGDPLIHRFTAVVLLEAPTDVRLRRLREREVERFGAEALQPGGRMYENHVEFLEWAAEYDDGGMDIRSRSRHAAWLAQLGCPVIAARGDTPPETLTLDVLAQIDAVR